MVRLAWRSFDLIVPTDVVNECDSAPCIHGGTCRDHLGRFDCECPQDYAGRQCELGKAHQAFYLVTKTQDHGYDLNITFLRRNAHVLFLFDPIIYLLPKPTSKATFSCDLCRDIFLE